MPVFLILVVTISLFLFAIKIGGSYAGRVTGNMVTNYFKAAEALTEGDSLPSPWLDKLRRMARRGSLMQHLPGGREWQDRGEEYLLKQIRRVRTYFSKSPFVDSEESRSILLSKLDEVVSMWESMRFEEITKHYGVKIEIS